MKYAPKKVFILDNGSYTELIYEEFCSLQENDVSYADKFFIPLRGMLMEVTEETYRDFYKSGRRQKYIDERSVENGDFSYDMLTTADFNGEDILIDTSQEIDEAVIHKIMLDKLHDSLVLLSDDEQKLINALFFRNLSERELSAETGIPQKNDKRPKTPYPYKTKKTFGKLKINPLSLFTFRHGK